MRVLAYLVFARTVVRSAQFIEAQKLLRGRPCFLESAFLWPKMSA
jgi:hypothetical protein